MQKTVTEKQETPPPIGVKHTPNGCQVGVWAPFADKIQIEIKDKPSLTALEKRRKGYWYGHMEVPGDCYKFIIDEKEAYPDPASLSQPEGVHSWSQVIDHSAFQWTDGDWRPVDLKKMIIYELHVGTYSEAGTFDGVVEKLDYLVDLGINTIELMPVCSFPGERNWGYDGVCPYAVHEGYGGVTKLKQLVNECHRNGVAVLLDVVYNHLGPEGNYLSKYGPYFTSKYKTPWGDAVNFDDRYSDEVREYFIQNALMWLRDYHFDGLRLDAVHAIYDQRPDHFLKSLAMRVQDLEQQSGKKYTLIAESDLNDMKMIKPRTHGGYGLDGVWADDFHHSVHTLVTGEKNGYLKDYGEVGQVKKAFQQGLVYDGIYSNYRKKTVGSSPADVHPSQLLVCIQNHDQIGNRMLGERLVSLVSFEEVKLMAGILLLSRFTPLLFMGEEYGEAHPFQYFVSHGDEALIKAVQMGRKSEFEDFGWEGEAPDPQAYATYGISKLSWNIQDFPQRKALLHYYKTLIFLRKAGVFESFRKKTTDLRPGTSQEEVLTFCGGESERLFVAFNFSSDGQEIHAPASPGGWSKILTSADPLWLGTYEAPDFIKGQGDLFIPPCSLMLYEKTL
jgi:maltooligosyltrehalose trehalohydrolase